MKHKVTGIVCAVLIVGLIVTGFALAQKQSVRDSVRNSIATQVQKEQDRRRAESVKNEYTKVNSQCKAGQAAYDSQTAAYRKTNPNRPVCDLPIVE